MIRTCTSEDFDRIYAIINDAASAYKGAIPADRWHEPYMSREELAREIEEGVEFSGWVQDGELVGVMGTQDKGDVVLIRHAYVATKCQGQGIGSQLLKHLVKQVQKPVLIGTWAAASWAIRFYQKNGFQLLPENEAKQLLERYWDIPKRQIETSVVLADRRWLDQQRGAAN